ncbi:hypothetical protein Tco_0671655 [Tanacetum coccineum]
MLFSRFTKVIINHFLSQHKSLFKLQFQHYHIIKDDGIVSRLKFVRIREDYHEYGLPIPDMMLNDKIKQLESYQMFIKYYTGQIPPKKSRGKGLQGKKTVDVSQESVDVSKESKPEPTKKRLLGTGGSSEGTGRILGVPDEFTVVSTTSSKGTGTKPGVLDEKKKKDNDDDADDEGDDHISDIQDTDDEDAETESDEDEIYKYKIHVRKDVDVEMAEAETVEHENKEKDEMTDAAKADVEKTPEEKGDAELAGNITTFDYQVKVSTEVPLPSSSISVSSGFGAQFLNSSYDISLTGVLKDFAEADKVLVSVIPETTNLPPIPEILTKTPVSTAISPPHVTPTISIMQQRTTPIPAQPIMTKSPTITTAVLESDSLTAKSASEIRKIKREQDEKQKMPKYTIKSTDKAALKEYDQKSALYQTMHGNKSFNRNPANHVLYHALMEALIEDENAMDKGVADTVKNHKRQHDDDDEDPPAGPNQGKKRKMRRTKDLVSFKKPSTTKETPKGKAPSKGSKTGKYASAKEPVKEPITEVAIDDAVNTAGEYVPWFNQMVSATKDPLTFNDLMATLINFSKYLLNRLKIENLTQDLLLGPAYNLLKGTCTNIIELEYNFQECFNALTNKLDWNNPEGDRYPFDLSKPLPLQGRPCHLTVAIDYFFNNDLEYLKTSDPEKMYTTSITKTKAARYEIVGIEDITPTLWSTIKRTYDKDAEKGIKHLVERRKLWYRSQMNKFSKHNVYSTHKILGVKSVSVKKHHGYGHLEEVVVKRANRQLYKFKEGDFVDLHLNDIEDMLLLAVQHKLFHLNDSDIVDFIVALRTFTRSLIIKRCVEDLQLRVES